MIFGLNSTIGSNVSVDNVKRPAVNEVKISNGIYDTLYLTVSKEFDYTMDIPDERDLYTILQAEYKGNILAGTIDYQIGVTNYFKIKRRKKGTLKWDTISIQAVDLNAMEDNTITFYVMDITNCADETYEYGVCSVNQGVESSISAIKEVYSTFDGIVICDLDKSFQTEMECTLTESQNGEPSVITTFGNRYPYVVKLGHANYASGNAAGMFCFLDEDCTMDFKESIKQRKELSEFLKDGKAKILKYFDGRIFAVGINSPVSQETGEHDEKVLTSFDWVEVCDANNFEELCNIGLAENNTYY